MTIYNGVRITLNCTTDGKYPATAANPWWCEIDFGHVLHTTGTGGAGTHSKAIVTAATLAALCTALQTTCTSAGVT